MVCPDITGVKDTTAISEHLTYVSLNPHAPMSDRVNTPMAENCPQLVNIKEASCR